MPDLGIWEHQVAGVRPGTPGQLHQVAVAGLAIRGCWLGTPVGLGSQGHQVVVVWLRVLGHSNWDQACQSLASGSCVVAAPCSLFLKRALQEKCLVNQHVAVANSFPTSRA